MRVSLYKPEPFPDISSSQARPEAFGADVLSGMVLDRLGPAGADDRTAAALRQVLAPCATCAAAPGLLASLSHRRRTPAHAHS